MNSANRFILSVVLSSTDCAWSKTTRLLYCKSQGSSGGRCAKLRDERNNKQSSWRYLAHVEICEGVEGHAYARILWVQYFVRECWMRCSEERDFRDENTLD